MGSHYLEDVFELFLLGALAEESAADLRAHLEAGCPSCQERIQDAALTVYLLSSTAKSGRPSPKLKSQLLHRLRKGRG